MSSCRYSAHYVKRLLHEVPSKSNFNPTSQWAHPCNMWCCKTSYVVSIVIFFWVAHCPTESYLSWMTRYFQSILVLCIFCQLKCCYEGCRAGEKSWTLQVQMTAHIFLGKNWKVSQLWNKVEFTHVHNHQFHHSCPKDISKNHFLKKRNAHLCVWFFFKFHLQWPILSRESLPSVEFRGKHAASWSLECRNNSASERRCCCDAYCLPLQSCRRFQFQTERYFISLRRSGMCLRVWRSERAGLRWFFFWGVKIWPRGKPPPTWFAGGPGAVFRTPSQETLVSRKNGSNVVKFSFLVNFGILLKNPGTCAVTV